ncbi:MAG: RNA polymerase sigma factor [Gemmatimonas sp.]
MADLDDELARHHGASFGWALVCCNGDRSVAEDVLQNAYLKLYDGRARFAGQSSVRAFLFSVIRRTASEDRRRRLVRAALSLSVLRSEGAESTEQVSGLTPIIYDETCRQLNAALLRLSSRQRQVIHLVFYQELTISAAAEILGISIGSARTHYERGKAQLRVYLEDIKKP